MEPEKQQVLEFLSQESVFAHVPKGSLSKLAGLARFQEVRRGQYLFTMGQPCNELHFLMEGHARVLLLAPDGRERLLHRLIPGDMVGAVPFFQGANYPCTTIADEDSAFVAFPKDCLMGLLHRDSEISLALIGGLISKTRELVGMLEEMTFRDTSHRLWKYLVDESHARNGNYPRILEPIPTRESIAIAIGTVREVVSRRLSLLIDSGHIRIQGRRMTLLKPFP